MRGQSIDRHQDGVGLVVRNYGRWVLWGNTAEAGEADSGVDDGAAGRPGQDPAYDGTRGKRIATSSNGVRHHLLVWLLPGEPQ